MTSDLYDRITLAREAGQEEEAQGDSQLCDLQLQRQVHPVV